MRIRLNQVWSIQHSRIIVTASQILTTSTQPIVEKEWTYYALGKRANNALESTSPDRFCALDT
jgi:hypothetical protein